MTRYRFEGWESIFECGTDYEADLVRDRLDDSGIPAVIHTQRDHAFNLTVGRLAPVHVMVQIDRIEEAAKLLATAPLSEKDLTDVALAADPNAPDAGADRQVRLDSGADDIRLSGPDPAS